MGEPVLHAAQPLGYSYRQYKPDGAEVSCREIGMVEDLQPDGLERGQGDRAALVDQLAERDVGVKVPGVHSGTPGNETGDEITQPANVEHGQGSPRRIVGPEMESSLGHQVALAD